MTTNNNYILVLYEKKDNEPPKFKGFKNLKPDEYTLLTKDFQSSIEVLGKRWGILERRWFSHELPDTNTHYVAIDAEKM